MRDTAPAAQALEQQSQRGVVAAGPARQGLQPVEQRVEARTRRHSAQQGHQFARPHAWSTAPSPFRRPTARAGARAGRARGARAAGPARSARSVLRPDRGGTNTWAAAHCACARNRRNARRAAASETTTCIDGAASASMTRRRARRTVPSASATAPAGRAHRPAGRSRRLAAHRTGGRWMAPNSCAVTEQSPCRCWLPGPVAGEHLARRRPVRTTIRRGDGAAVRAPSASAPRRHDRNGAGRCAPTPWTPLRADQPGSIEAVCRHVEGQLHCLQGSSPGPSERPVSASSACAAASRRCARRPGAPAAAVERTAAATPHRAG